MIDQETYALAVAYAKGHGGGGGGGTNNYNELSNRPQINSTTLSGNKSAHDLGLASEPVIDGTQITF
jgi:hypothetical protein